jgi:hypothetical protein
MPERHPRGTEVRTSQELMMLRVRVYIIGHRRFTFWQAEGCKPHIGRGCNMKAMGDAVRTAPARTVVKKP